MLPNLFGFSGCDKTCLVLIKCDGCLCLDGLLVAANRAGAGYIFVTCGDGSGLAVITISASTSLLLFTVFGTSGSFGFYPFAIGVTESGDRFYLFVIAVLAGDGFRTGFGTSCCLCDVCFKFVLANIVTAFCSGGVGNFNRAKSCLLRLGVLEFKSGSIDAEYGNNFSIYCYCVTSILQAVNKIFHIFICRNCDDYLLNHLSIFSRKGQFVFSVESVVIVVCYSNRIRSTIFEDGYNKVIKIPRDTITVFGKGAGRSENIQSFFDCTFRQFGDFRLFRFLGFYCRRVCCHPNIFEFRSIIVGAYNGIDGNGITNYGLGSHIAIAGRTVCAVETVDVDLVAVGILNIKVAEGGVSNRFDNTGDVILLCSEVVMLIQLTQSNRLLNGENRVCCRGHDGFAIVIAEIVVVGVGVVLNCNFLLCNENGSANKAVLAFGFAGLCAGSGYCFVDYFNVSRNLTNCLTYVTSGVASVIVNVSGSLANCLTNVTGCIASVIVFVLFGDALCAANITILVASVIIGVGVSVVYILTNSALAVDIVVTGCLNLIACVRVAAYATSVGGITNRGTGGGSNLCSVVVACFANCLTNVTSCVASVVVNVSGNLANCLTNVTSGIASVIVNVSGNLANCLANVTSDIASVIVNVSGNLAGFVTLVTSGIASVVVSVLTSRLGIG